MQVNPSQSNKAPIVTQLDNNTLKESGEQKSYWKKIKCTEQQGNTEFQIGNICPDICLTRSRCLFNKDYHAQINYNEETTLLVFGVKGYSSFRCGENCRLHTIGPGEIWLVHTNKEQLFRYTPAGQENEMVVIKYASHRLCDNLQQDDNPSLPYSRITRLGHQAFDDSQIVSLINNKLETVANRLLAESQALALLARWIEPRNKEVKTACIPSCKKLSLSEGKCIKTIIDILTCDLINTPSLNELAEQVNMSHTKLNRCFKKAYGTTVYNWLRNYRLDNASQYLAEKDSNITDIAFQCGFSSASHFAHAFKQQYGCSPIKYREQYC